MNRNSYLGSSRSPIAVWILDFKNWPMQDGGFKMEDYKLDVPSFQSTILDPLSWIDQFLKSDIVFEISDPENPRVASLILFYTKFLNFERQL